MPLWLICCLIALSALVPLIWLLRKRIDAVRYALSVALLLSVLFALCNSVYPPDYAVHEFTLFKPFRDINTYGYAAIFENFLQFSLPFAPLGFLLPFVFVKRMRCMWQAVLAALALILLSFAVRLIFPLERSLNIDELWYAPLGAAVGFSLYTLFCWICHGRSFAGNWKLPPMRPRARWAALAVIGAVYFAAAILMIIDSALTPPLNIPSSESPLPPQRAVSFTPDEAPVRLSLYKAAESNLSRDYGVIAAALGIESEPVVEENRVRLEFSGRKLDMLKNGEWHYEDKMAEEASKNPMALDEASSVQKARDFLDQTGLASQYKLLDVTRMSASDDDGNDLGTSAYAVYFSSLLDNYTLRMTGEITVTVGFQGYIVSADKYGPDFAKAQDVSVISLKRAVDSALASDVAHTLYDEADSVVFTGGELVYWFDESNGRLQPVWVLSGTSHGPGGENDFEAFVPAN